MSSIQWFPGHMNAARKKAAETMKTTDLVIEVLDARIPLASCNPMVEELRLFRQRPSLKILNKSDLADPAVTKEWIDFFEKGSHTRAVAISARHPAEVARIPGICQQIVPNRGEASKPLRMMIMGIPNVGKSTLMNMLLKRRVAAVGDEPAVTKSQQRLYLNKGMILIDTPGMLWPKIRYPDDGMMLAASHAVGVNALIEEEVAVFLAEVLLDRYPGLLAARYGMETTDLDGFGVVESVAKRRGFKVRGGDFDMEKASQILLNDYRSGSLGRISLETPETRKAMMAAFDAAATAEKSVRESKSPDSGRD
ncbi:ribosome biogenesis GTPase YlqF [Oxalobacter sp. OttesenSCG-928-P03]|nr:ribosome biogenesis GTPase YlqF [Oxalobacter sp. OttesenSCG-928-P03]